MTPTARIITSGDDEILLFPEEIQIASEFVEIFRRGEEVILVEVPGAKDQSSIDRE